mgnify:CR=1 FL=1
MLFRSRNYRVRVKLADMGTNQSGISYKIFTLPDNWFTHGAIRHAWTQFRAAYQDELAQTGGVTARWFDFRLDPSGADGTPEVNDAYPSFFDGTSFSYDTTGLAASTTASTVTDSDGDEMTFGLFGAEDKSGAGKYNIMLEYARYLTARRVDNAPAETGPQSYEGLLPNADDLDRLMEDGDTAPYDDSFGSWHGSADSNGDVFLQQVGTLLSGDADPSGVKASTDWFNAPLGLIWVYGSTDTALPGGSSTVTPYLRVEAAAGSYKGVKAPPIVDYKTLVPKALKTTSPPARNWRIGVAG